MKRIALLAAVAVVLTSAVAGTVATRRPEPSRTVQVVRLRLSADGKELARISTPDGVAAIMSREGGEEIAVTPAVLADGSVVVAIAVRDAAPGDFKSVARYSLVRYVAADVSTERTSLSVEWLETATVTVNTGMPVSGLGPCTSCCVICDGVTFCACEVTTSCGHCCCREACGCVDGA